MAFAEGAQDGALNGTNVVTVVSSPGASTRRIVKLINIHNVDTVSQTINVFYVHGASSRKLRSVTLGAGQTLVISDTLVLDDTDKSLTANMGAAATTTNPDFVSSYADAS